MLHATVFNETPLVHAFFPLPQPIPTSLYDYNRAPVVIIIFNLF